MERIDVLQKEHERIGAIITTHYISLDRILGLGFVVFGTATAVGTASGRTVITAILTPVFLGVVSLYALDTLHEMMMAAGYKRHLEERINRELDDSSLLWESWISKPLAQRGAGKSLLFLIYTVVVFIASGVSIVAAFRYSGDYRNYVRWGDVAFWAFYWLSALTAALEGFGAADLVEGWVAEARIDNLRDRDELFSAWSKQRTWFGLFLRKPEEPPD